MKKYPFAKLQSKLTPAISKSGNPKVSNAAEMDVYSPDLKRFEMPSASYKKKAMKVAEERLALPVTEWANCSITVFGAAQ